MFNKTIRMTSSLQFTNFLVFIPLKTHFCSRTSTSNKHQMPN
uniref:Uncharacterized protein n=1 Tax=Rhizophora mucronata TaxID=61149 RepID=A0A2P2PSX3_RHIMU